MLTISLIFLYQLYVEFFNLLGIYVLKLISPVSFKFLNIATRRF